MKTILLAGMAALAIMTSAANASCPSSLSPADHFDCRMKEIDREQREEARNQILRDQADAMREQADAMREQNRILEQAERQRQLDSFLSRPFPTYQFR